MKKIFNWKFILLAITLIAAFLRFYQLGNIPPGFHTDEAYLGYNAFSVLKTAREMTGNFLPIHLESFLYSPAGYVYFSIPFVALFGLSEFSVRFASALFGSLTPILVFFLVKEIFFKWKNKETIGLISAFFLAISPWHINLSRVATDNVIVVFLIILGTILYLNWLKKGKLYLLIAAFICFLISIFTYQAPRSFLPLFLPFIFIYSASKDYKKKIVIPLILFIALIIVPIVCILVSPTLSYRIRTLSIFQNPSTQLVLEEQLREDGVLHVSPVEARLFHNKVINYSLTFTHNYFAHFSYDFLFTDAGLPDRYRIPDMGLLYFFDIPFIIIGLFSLVNKDKRLGFFLIGWVLLVPVGSALTFDDIPNLQRTLAMIPAISIISAVGFIEIINFLRNVKNKRNIVNTFLLIILAFMLYNFSFYLHSYYVQQIDHRPWYRDEGYKELVQAIDRYSSSFKHIIITNSNGGPSIFLFFFNKYDPSHVQKIVLEANTTDYGNLSFDKYLVSRVECPLTEEKKVDLKTGRVRLTLSGANDTLYIDNGTCLTPKTGVKTLAIIKRGDGTNVFKLLIREN
jgi:4-amino-4-deoxy-L-arabinose transferase-like glycosyltransferase